MKLEKTTSRKIAKMVGYKGVCNGCGSPLEYDNEIIAIELEQTETVIYVVPIDTFECPGCHKYVSTMQIWKNLDISGELAQIKKNL